MRKIVVHTTETWEIKNVKEKDFKDLKNGKIKASDILEMYYVEWKNSSETWEEKNNA